MIRGVQIWSRNNETLVLTDTKDNRYNVGVDPNSGACKVQVVTRREIVGDGHVTDVHWDLSEYTPPWEVARFERFEQLD